MATKKITDLVEITTAAAHDVLPIVDVSLDITNKITTTNLLKSKQDLLESGTNIKTINSTSLLGSGDVAVQETLVSGTNIKTINSTSLLGSGDISIEANPSGGAGAIQFSNGSAFASDAANLFWDDTNNRLGVGTNAPSVDLEVKTTNVGDFDYVNFKNGNNANTARFKANGGVILGVASDFAINAGSSTLTRFSAMIGSLSSPTARLQVVGSGSTSATTSLLVQNSAGTAALTVRDDLSAIFGGAAVASAFSGTGYFSLVSEQRLVIGISPNRTLLRPSGDGILCIINGGETNFNRLQFGGTTSSFPAIKRASNNIEIKNADDTFGAGLSVGAALNASAILQADSTTKGFLPPRMTTAQKNAIASPAAGLVVYDTTLNKLCVRTASAWETITSL
jgi:hypothetical protein